MAPVVHEDGKDDEDLPLICQALRGDPEYNEDTARHYLPSKFAAALFIGDTDTGDTDGSSDDDTPEDSNQVSERHAIQVKVEKIISNFSSGAESNAGIHSLAKECRKLAYHVNTSLLAQRNGRDDRFANARLIEKDSPGKDDVSVGQTMGIAYEVSQNNCVAGM